MFNSNLVQNVNLKLNNTFRNYSFLPRAAVPQWPQHDTGPARHGTQVRVKITRSESEVKFPRPRVPSRPVPSSPRPRSRGRIPLPATGLGSKTPCMPARSSALRLLRMRIRVQSSDRSPRVECHQPRPATAGGAWPRAWDRP